MHFSDRRRNTTPNTVWELKLKDKLKLTSLSPRKGGFLLNSSMGHRCECCIVPADFIQIVRLLTSLLTLCAFEQCRFTCRPTYLEATNSPRIITRSQPLSPTFLLESSTPCTLSDYWIPMVMCIQENLTSVKRPAIPMARIGSIILLTVIQGPAHGSSTERLNLLNGPTMVVHTCEKGGLPKIFVEKRWDRILKPFIWAWRSQRFL